MRPHHPSRGFTLIEVLVVVAIIALLIAILLPSLAAARAQGRTTLCLSNLHQAGIAITTYSVENKGFVPRGGNVERYWTDGDVHWTAVVLRQVGSNMSGVFRQANRNGDLLSQLLWEEMKKQKVFQCPERSGDSGAQEVISYCVNAFGRTPSDPEVRKPTQITTWKRPGQVVYLTELEYSKYSGTMLTAFQERDLSYFDIYSTAHLPSAPKANRRAARAMHQKRNTACMFVDGHSEPIASVPRSGEAELDLTGSYARRWQIWFGLQLTP